MSKRKRSKQQKLPKPSPIESRQLKLPRWFCILVDTQDAIARMAGAMLALSFTMPDEAMPETPWLQGSLQHLDSILSTWFAFGFIVRATVIKPWQSYVFSARGGFCFLASLPPTGFAQIEALRHLGRFLMAASTQFFVDAIQNMLTLVLVGVLAGNIIISIVEDSDDGLLWVVNQVLPFVGLPTEFSPTTVSGHIVGAVLTLVRYAALTWLGALVIKTWRIAVGDKFDSSKDESD